MLLIGSRALALRSPQCLTRQPLDFDFVGSQEEYDQWYQVNVDKIKPTQVYQENNNTKWIVRNKKTICEFQIVQPGSSDQLLMDLVKNNKETLETSFGNIPSLDLLFTIKDSHKYKKFEKSDHNFWKTALDWHMMKRAGAEVKSEYEAFSKLRKQETYTYAHPKLNVNKDNFFSNNGIEQIFEHDDLHKIVALYNQPAYISYLQDGEEVKSSKKKFFEVSEEIRMAGALEEALTLALERSLIPHPGVWGPDLAFRFALAKASSSITSGFFREYIFNNIFDVIKLYEKTSKNYLKKFEDAVKSGNIRYIKDQKTNDNQQQK
jgi:hypothetical protein